jgi:hypothetical protein
MKPITILFIIALAFSSFIAIAQAPLKEWDLRFGGLNHDGFRSLQQTTDGGYIIGGYSNSIISGDKTQASQGYYDYWILKTDGNGIKQWDARFGGSKDEYLGAVQQTPDGGYILGGYSFSKISGDKTQASQGGADYWIVKTDGNGVKQWDARFGGTKDDIFHSLQQTADGGYILGGYSDSGISGDKTQASQGGFDYWIVKTDGNGVKQWDARFGGDHHDYFSSIQQTSDGGYMMGGYSDSGISGDKTQANQGGTDYWIVKTDGNGVTQWDARFGGSDDDVCSSLQQTVDGGYMLGGTSSSGISGDKTQPSQGDEDYWIIKTDSNGAKQWDARFGGSDYDVCRFLHQTDDGGYILGGFSSSGSSGDKTQPSQGVDDYWIVKTDGNGAKQWDARFGGSDYDIIRMLQQTTDGGYVLGGTSSSGSNGDKTQASQGDWDYWIVKTESEVPVSCGEPSDLLVSAISATSVTISWTPATGAEHYKAGYRLKGSDEWIAIKDPFTGIKILGTSITVTGLTPNTTYQWRVAAFCDGELNPSAGIKGPSFTTLPLRLASTELTLFEVHPNPFSTYTTISFSLNKESDVQIELYDAAGKKLQSLLDENVPAGNYELNFNRNQLSAGIYFHQDFNWW